ncbi:MAG: PKD domain-containing protein [Firmicutes bacterium]|nr:PKD domain-containing protein [Bacillota bacterium]
MRKYYIIITLLLVLVFSNVALGVASDQKAILINREIQVGVEKANQKLELLIPAEPLEFASTLTWEVTFPKKPSLTSEKVPASLIIEETGKNPRQIERKIASASGTLTIPKGIQYKATLNAGEYTGLLGKYGLAAKLKLNFSEAQVKYTLLDQPYLFELEILGPVGITEWAWLWGNDPPGVGAKVTHQFKNSGKTPIIIEGKGKTPTGTFTRKFWLELEVPELVILNPKVEPLSGPAELDVKAQVNAVVNYGQRATYRWNFGSGEEISGPEAHFVYQNPGRYQLVLTAVVSGASGNGAANDRAFTDSVSGDPSKNNYIYQKTWLVEVSPLTILSNATVTPALGPVPLQVTGSLKPKISGGPTKLSYLWDIAGEKETGTDFKRTFTEPGDYRILLKISDELHPNLVIPEEVFLVKALAPQISLNPTGSGAGAVSSGNESILQGATPLAVNFDPGIHVSGSPVDLSFLWDFGDGETSALEKPAHIFKKTGLHQVRLTVSDALHKGNLAQAIIKVNALAPKMELKAAPSIKSGVFPLQVQFTAEVSVTGSPCEPQYFWDFGDGETSFDQNPVHIYRQSGTYTAVVEVKDRLHADNAVKASFPIAVKIPELRITASISPATGKAPLTVTCKAEGIETALDEDEPINNSSLKYLWDFGDGTTAEGATQTHTYEKAGTYNASVTVRDEAAGVSAKKTFKITVR